MKKLLVWDGDDTLWKGTILEGDKVDLFPGRFEMCKQLAERGVLQSIASHNSLGDIQRVLHRFNLEPFFLASQASLMIPKHEMIYEIVRQLKLTRLTDVVFVDDNSSNRGLVAAACPGVVVRNPDEIKDVVNYYFSKQGYTSEDKGRVASYKAEQEREKSSQSYKNDYTRFLHSCNIKLELFRPKDEDMQRIIDLIIRSNQLSAVAEKYSEKILKEAQPDMWACRVHDAYGDYGLSAVMWVRDKPSVYPGNALVEICLMVVSCRLQGKGIGSAMLGWLINKNVGKFLTAEMIITTYNEQMQNLYKWHGFDPYEDGDSIQFRKYCGLSGSLPPWIYII